jgi:putative transposase
VFQLECPHHRVERDLGRGQVYNATLEQSRSAYQATGKHQSALSQWPYLRDWRNAYADFLLNASRLQHTLRRVDKAFAALFRRVKAGEPLSQHRVHLRRRLPGGL